MMNLSRRILSFSNIIKILPKRTLFSERTLGVSAYEDARLQTKPVLESQYIFAVQNESVELLVKATKRYLHSIRPNGDTYLLKCGFQRLAASTDLPKEMQFNYGPIVMRMFHLFNMPKEALEFYEEFGVTLFDEKTTVIILFDLLFNNEKYEEILQISDKLEVEAGRDSMHNVFTFGAFYKLNTPKHLEWGLRLWNNCNVERQFYQSRHFLAMLAVNQMKPEFAMNILSANDTTSRSISAYNVRLLALNEANDFKGIAELLFKLKKEYPTNPKRRVSYEVLDRIRENLNKNRTIPFWGRYDRVLIEFQQLVGPSKTSIDEVLCWPIDFYVGKLYNGQLHETKETYYLKNR